MSKKTTIHQWLQDPEPGYEQGLNLLRESCQNKGLLSLLSKKENSYNKQKMRHELEKIYRQLPDDQEPAGEPAGSSALNPEPTGAGDPGEPAGGQLPNGGQLPEGSGQPAEPTPPGSGGVVVMDAPQGVHTLPGHLLLNEAGQVVGGSQEALEGHQDAQQRLSLERAEQILPGFVEGLLEQSEPPATGQEQNDPVLAGFLPRTPTEEAPAGPQDGPGQPGGEQVISRESMILEASEGLPGGPVLSALDKLTIEGSQLYLERVKLSNTLASLGSDEARRAAVEQIQALEEKLEAINSQKEYILNHNELPPQGPPVPVPAAEQNIPRDRAQLTQELANVRSQVSKAKKASTNSPTDVRKREKWQKLEVQKQELEDQLKMLEVEA